MTPIQLRPYQTDIVSGARDAYRRGLRAPLVVSPTGSGKTVIFAHIARGTSANGRRVMILVHRQELLDQTSRTLGDLQVPHGVIAASRTMDLTERVQIASVQTVVRRLGDIPPPDLIVIDEAHHATAGSWRKVIDYFPNAKILGVTATPERLDGKGLSEVFEEIIRGPEVRDLIRDGFLCPPMYYAPPGLVDLSGIRIRGGDYDQQQVAEAMDKPAITGDAVEHYSRICRGVPAVAFCASIKHAEHVAEQFRAAGFRSATIDGTLTRDDRRQRVRDLGNGRLHVLTSCEIINEGFDLPIVTAAILLRPTQSLGLHLQQIGRVLRPAPGKAKAIILDHVGNLHRHGLAEDVRDWSLEGAKTRKKKAKEADTIRTRQCPQCFCCHEWAPKCPECGREYVADPREIEIREGELERLGGIIDERHRQCVECHTVHSRWDSSCPKCGLILDASKARKKEHGRAQTLEDLIALGRRKGYKNPTLWANHVWKSRQSKKSGSLDNLPAEVLNLELSRPQ